MEKKIITIDIIQNILQAPAAVGSYRGKEVHNFIENEINKLTSNSILVLDFKKALPLQYVFCQYAFGPLLKSLQQDTILPVVFRMHEHHKQCFFRGVIKHIDKDLSRDESEKAFVKSGMFTMILLDDNVDINFISNLTPIEEKVLNFINSTESISQRNIIEAKENCQPSDIIDSLRSLVRKGFILHLTDGREVYYSICQLIKNQ